MARFVSKLASSANLRMQRYEFFPYWQNISVNIFSILCFLPHLVGFFMRFFEMCQLACAFGGRRPRGVGVGGGADNLAGCARRNEKKVVLLCR
jgi:hypothetical protein